LIFFDKIINDQVIKEDIEKKEDNQKLYFKYMIINNPKLTNNQLIDKYFEKFNCNSLLGHRQISNIKSDIKKTLIENNNNETFLDQMKYNSELLSKNTYEFLY
jgi:hypothetical protein